MWFISNKNCKKWINLKTHDHDRIENWTHHFKSELTIDYNSFADSDFFNKNKKFGIHFLNSSNGQFLTDKRIENKIYMSTRWALII